MSGEVGWGIEVVTGAGPTAIIAGFTAGTRTRVFFSAACAADNDKVLKGGNNRNPPALAPCRQGARGGGRESGREGRMIGWLEGVRPSADGMCSGAFVMSACYRTSADRLLPRSRHVSKKRHQKV